MGKTVSLAPRGRRSRKAKKRGGGWRDVSLALLGAVLLALAVKSFLIQPFRIPSRSMEDSLLAGDYVLVDKLTYGARLPFTELRFPALSAPNRGEIILFESPVNPERLYAKRCVATAGEVVEVRNKVLYVDGARIPDPPYSKFLDARIFPASERPRDNFGPLRIPNGHIFVLGDNRDNSRDSRHWGMLSHDRMIGRALFIYWSYEPFLSTAFADFHAPEAKEEFRSFPERVRWGESWSSRKMTDIGLYVHIPFCPQLCPYCAFATVAGELQSRDRYVAALVREIGEAAESLPSEPRVDTLFLGGGTPSLLEPGQIEAVLSMVDRAIGFSDEPEITIEANPGTADAGRFKAYRQLGVNRISIGVQSFSDATLRLLGRIHDATEAHTAFEASRRAGFENVSMDLISGVPGEPQEQWRESIEQAILLEPEHLSTYGLTIEEGTIFAERRRSGRLGAVPEEDDLAAYVWTHQRLTESGFEHYEVSNFAKGGRRSRHNMGYWTGRQYLGVGMSAHSFLNGERCWNSPVLADYLAAVENGRSPKLGRETICPDTALRERLWLGLRTTDGVLLNAIETVRLSASKRFQNLFEAGFAFIERAPSGNPSGAFSGARLRLTPRGLALADEIGVEIHEMWEQHAKEYA